MLDAQASLAADGLDGDAGHVLGVVGDRAGYRAALTTVDDDRDHLEWG
jgi:hypothetical protein